jgi:hypothetical protein
MKYFAALIFVSAVAFGNAAGKNETREEKILHAIVMTFASAAPPAKHMVALASELQQAGVLAEPGRKLKQHDTLEAFPFPFADYDPYVSPPSIEVHAPRVLLLAKPEANDFWLIHRDRSGRHTFFAGKRSDFEKRSP